MKRSFLMVVALVALCGCATFRFGAEKSAEPWPLAQGTRWVYAGTVIRTVGQNQVTTNAARLTCEVLEAQLLRGHLVARVTNFPLAFSAWETAATNAVMLIRTPGGEFYAMEAGQARHVLARLADAKDPLDGLLDADTQILAWPLRCEQRWGEAAEPPRLDGWYCWRVEKQREERLHGITGVAWWRKQTIFEIAFRTNPDHMLLQFSPRLGLLAYDYIHHGTPAEVHLKLVEFHQPSATR